MFGRKRLAARVAQLEHVLLDLQRRESERLNERLRDLERQKRELRVEGEYQNVNASVQVMELLVTALTGHLASGRKPHPEAARQIDLFLRAAGRVLARNEAAHPQKRSPWIEAYHRLRMGCRVEAGVPLDPNDEPSPNPDPSRPDGDPDRP